MTSWPEILDAVGTALQGDRSEGQRRLLACWEGAAPGDHAQRCVLAHYLADLEPELDDEIAWDEHALAAFAFVGASELAVIGIPAAAGMAPSLHLNLGDGYLRAGRLRQAREQWEAGRQASSALPDDGYGALIRAGLMRLGERLAVAQGFPQSGGPRGPTQPDRA